MIIRDYLKGDEVLIWKIYQQAFAGFPWFENLSDEEVQSRWKTQSSKDGFECIVAEESGRIVGASWWDTPTLKDLANERGKDLADFSREKNFPLIVWIRETVVDPLFQKRGVAKKLKQESLDRLSKRKPCLVLTRMREDNKAIIRINESVGFVRTGIKRLSSQVAGVFHEYWYLEIK